MTVFYPKFERHSHGEGLKGQSTHYCAGCGHGLVVEKPAETLSRLLAFLARHPLPAEEKTREPERNGGRP